MPDPRKLKIGDRVKFIALPEEWKQPNIGVHRDSVEFMRYMIRRKFPSRVAWIDDCGIPWINARTYRRGQHRHESWAISESTGWRKVIPRKG